MLDPYVKPLSSGSVMPWLTADRIVTTNSLSQLATPSSISTPQSLTLSGTATLTVAGLLTAQSGLTVSSNAAVSGTATVTGLLTASSALTVASTVTLQGITTVIDGNFSIIGSGDPTKTIKFEVDAQTAADDLTINSGAQTDDRTLTVPVLAGNDTLVALAVANPFTGNNTMAGTLELTTASNGLTISKTTGTTLSAKSTQSASSSITGAVVVGDGATATGNVGIGGGRIWAGGNNHQFGDSSHTSLSFVTVYDEGSVQFMASGTNTYWDTNIRPASGNSAFLSFTEAGVADRWSIGCVAGDATLHFSSARVATTGTLADRMTLTSTALTLTTNATAGLTIAAATGTTLTVSSTTDSTSKDTGSIVTEGGLGVEKAIFAGTNITAAAVIRSTAASGAAQLRVDSVDAAISRPSNAFYCMGGGGFDQGISLGPSGGVSIYQVANAAWRCTTTGSTDNLYVDFARWTWRDPSDGFNEKMTLFNGLLTLPVTTGVTLTVSSTNAASVTLAGGILLDGATTKTIKYTNGTANAAVAVTFGAVGPTGSTAGNQVGWLRVNIGGTDRYIPYW